jgi:hypothetical protein
MLKIIQFMGVWHEIFDFRFFHVSVFLRSLIIPSRPFRVFTKSRVDIYNFVFVVGVVVTNDKLISVSLTPVIKPCLGFSSITCHRGLIYCRKQRHWQWQQYQLAYTSKYTFSINSGISKKYEKSSCLKIFFIYRRVCWHHWLTFIFEYLREIS